jgi:hypothetical protein
MAEASADKICNKRHSSLITTVIGEADRMLPGGLNGAIGPPLPVLLTVAAWCSH